MQLTSPRDEQVDIDGTAVERLRSQLGISQGRLGRLAQLTRGRVSQIERASLVRVNRPTAERLAQALQTSVVALVVRHPSVSGEARYPELEDADVYEAPFLALDEPQTREQELRTLLIQMQKTLRQALRELEEAQNLLGEVVKRDESA